MPGALLLKCSTTWYLSHTSAQLKGSGRGPAHLLLTCSCWQAELQPATGPVGLPPCSPSPGLLLHGQQQLLLSRAVLPLLAPAHNQALRWINKQHASYGPSASHLCCFAAYHPAHLLGLLLLFILCMLLPLCVCLDTAAETRRFRPLIRSVFSMQLHKLTAWGCAAQSVLSPGDGSSGSFTSTATQQDTPQDHKAVKRL